MVGNTLENWMTHLIHLPLHEGLNIRRINVKVVAYLDLLAAAYSCIFSSHSNKIAMTVDLL
jgi:hypothetical protein